MIEYNNTDEFNSIETGNTVYISGLPGKNYSYVNNKYGYVKDIYLTFEGGRINYSAKVILFSDNNEYFVNFDYIFKMGKMNNADIQSLIWEENPFNHYVIKKNLVECYALQDENGQRIAVCSDSEKRKHVFLYSGVN